MLNTNTGLIRRINHLFIIVSISFVFMYFLVFTASLSKMFSTFDNIEESAYTYTSASNYLRYGLRNSFLLQDFSSSPYPQDHPFVYDHMPPGPDLLMAAMLRVTSRNIEQARYYFAAVSFCGLLIYLVTAFLLLERFGYNSAGIALFVVVTGAMALYARLIYALLPALTFLPLLMYLIYLKRPSRPIFFYIALVTILVSSLYIEYSFLSAAIFSWIMFYVTGLLPLTRRQIVAICSAFALGILLHVVQNFLFLGPTIAFKELSLTLSNRIRGIPTQSELHAFFQSIKVVHHGAHPILPGALLRVVYNNLTIPGMADVEKLVIYLFLWAYCGAWALTKGNVPGALRAACSEIRVPVCFLLWLFVTLCAPIFLFPAFAQEVNLYGAGGNLLFLGIVTALVMGRGLSVLLSEIELGLAFVTNMRLPHFSSFPKTASKEPVALSRLSITSIRVILVVGIAFTLARVTLTLLSTSIAELKGAVNQIVESDHLKSLYAIGPSYSDSFMTNINSPTVGFLTREPGFGVCGPGSIGSKGEIFIEECKISYMRRSEYWKERRPGYFFYFERPDLFPGFADCMPNGAAGIEGGSRASADCMSVLLNRLADNYPMVLHNDIVRVFDLGGAKKLELTPSYHEYPREESGDRWWYWVRDKISFAVVDTSDIARQRSVSFDYSLLADQHLSVIIVGEHDQLRRDLTQSGSGEQHFNLVLPASLGRLESIDMSGEGAGQGLRLSASDARTARFQLSDLEVMVVGAESPPK